MSKIKQTDHGAEQFTRWFPLPSANYNAAELSVMHPQLLDCAGIDGRFEGALRSFPGFRAVGIAEAYHNVDTGEALGPMLVGPHHTHVRPALEITYDTASENPTVSYDLENLTLTLVDGSGTTVRPLAAVGWTTALLKDWFDTAAPSGWSAVLSTDEDGTTKMGALAPMEGNVGTVDGSATDFTLEAMDWVHWPMKYDGQTQKIQFFKYIEFLKEASFSDLGNRSGMVSGFVMFWKDYEGPLLADTPGMSDDDDPRSGQDLVVFLYYDDEAYPLPYRDLSAYTNTATKEAGWRVRILTPNEYNPASAGIRDTEATSFTTMDVTAWGTAAYLCNTHGLADDDNAAVNLGQVWGSSNPASSVADEDTVEGTNAVLEWDMTYHYPRLRQMGPVLLTGSEPKLVTAATGTTDGVPTIATVGGKIGFQGAGGSELAIRVGVSFYNSKTNSRSLMYEQDVVVINPGAVQCLYARINIHEDTWDLYDRIEVWRSPAGATGVLFREHTRALGSAPPAFDAAIDPSADVSQFVVTWGVLDVTAATWNARLTINTYRGAFIVEGLDNYGVMQQLPFNGVYEFAANPPTDCSRLLVDNQICYAVASAGTPYFHWVPPRLRWTSLAIPNPENFADAYNLWRPDEHCGMVYDLVKAGDTIFILGTRTVVATRRSGSRLAISAVGDDYAPVTRRAWTVGGDTLFMLTKEGIVAMSGIDGSITPIQSLNRALLSYEGWGQELLQDIAERDSIDIGMAYDEAGGCLFIWNVKRQEAFVYWSATGRTTRLYDFTFQWATRGYMFSPGMMALRSFLAGSWTQGQSSQGAHFEIYFPDFTPGVSAEQDTGGLLTGTAKGMMGETLVLDGGVPTNLDATVRTGVVTSFTHYSGALYRVTKDVGLVISSAAKTRLRRRLLGSTVHVFTADGQGHARGWIDEVNFPSDTSFEYVVNLPTKTTPPLSQFGEGVTYSVAPVVVRVVPAFVTTENQEIGNDKTLISGQIKMDVVAVRKFASDSSAQSVDWIGTADAIGLNAIGAGLRLIESSLEDADSYGPSNLEFNPDPQFAYRIPFDAPGRLEEITRDRITPDRQEGKTAFKLQFSGNHVTTGLELYCSGVQVELQALRLIGIIKPSARRSET
jgi:hypothetical protein